MKSSSPLVGVVLGLLILSLLFLGIERGLGRRRGKPHFRRGWLLDVGYFFLTYMPPGRFPEDFGIPEEFPRDLLGQMTRPFARLVGKK